MIAARIPASEWEKLSDPTAKNIMTEGMRLKFRSPPPLSLLPPPHAITSPKQVKLISPFVPDWLERGVIRRIPKDNKIPLFFSRMFSVPKKLGKVRPIIDLSVLNKMLVVPKFRMETLDKIVRNICEALWGTSVDITDAYLHVPIAWEYHVYFAFVLGEETYVFQVLPFGLSSAPWTFSRVMKPIKRYLHSLGVLVFSFLDDFLILGVSRPLTESYTKTTTDLLQKLGFSVNWEKSSIVPQQRLEYLGIVLDLQNFTLSLPQEKIEKILSYVDQDSLQSRMSRRDLERLIGFLNFTAPYLPLGRLYLIPLMVWMNHHTTTSSRDTLVPLDEVLKSALIPWSDREVLSTPVPMHLPPPTIEIMTDASSHGWSGWLLPEEVFGEWDPSLQFHSMNWKELKAIHLTLLHFGERLRGQSVRILTDNTTAVACLRRQGSVSSTFLWELSRVILVFAQDMDITLLPVHLSGVLNVLADMGSREGPISTEWSLDPRSFWDICDLVGYIPEVDLFATRFNSQLPIFISPFPDQLAAGQDALNLDWNRWSSIYLFPPIQILPEVIRKLDHFLGKGFLLAPNWGSDSWYPFLLRRSRRQFPVPRGFFLSQQTNEGICVLDRHQVSVWKLTVWML